VSGTSRRSKRRRNTTCPQCGEVFFSRKLRHRHQMTKHRDVLLETPQEYKARTQAELALRKLREEEVLEATETN